MNKFEESQCSCEKCQNMCKKCPCLATPEEIDKIAAAGFADKLAHTEWAVGLQFGMPLITMVQIRALPSTDNQDGAQGQCPFYNEKGLCDLHDLGLKPMEGRLANHANTPNVALINILSVVREWMPLQKYFKLVKRQQNAQ